MQSPSDKQILAIENVRKGLSARQAMLQAGYAPSTADNPGTHLWGLVGTQMYLAALQEEHIQQGNTPAQMAEDLKEMRQACKEDGSPDWNTRMRAQELLRRDMGLWDTGRSSINQIALHEENDTKSIEVVFVQSYAEEINNK